MLTDRQSGKWTAVALATALLAINFWAWSLLPPLATAYGTQFALSPVALSTLLAMPVLVGSLGRIPLGLLTDRYGGRVMFAGVCLAASAATVGVALAGSYGQLLAGAFCLGVAGASFAVGVPYVNSWFPPEKRGFALGVYALGNAGTAISGLLTPRLSEHLSRPLAFYAIATVLAAAGLYMALRGRNAPGWKPAKGSLGVAFFAAIRWPSTRKLALLYGITFGAFVAFGVYLPVLLKIAYHLELADAAARAAGFVLLATLARPIGGWLSDRFGGVYIIRGALIATAGLSGLVAFEPSLMPYGTVAYLSLAAMLGLGNGAIFAILGRRCDPKLVGSVTGIVGAAGGLGGFFPPLVLGASLQLFHSFTVALILLTATALAVLPATYRISNYHGARA